jgi:hypothetical protein
MKNKTYSDTKTVADNSPAWANGCTKCKFGVVDSMPLTRVTDLMTERVVQMDMGTIQFCDCQAGAAYKRSVTVYRDKLIDEACKNPMMAMAARRASHPDIDSAREAMMAAQPAPTFNGEKVPA